MTTYTEEQVRRKTRRAFVGGLLCGIVGTTLIELAVIAAFFQAAAGR